MIATLIYAIVLSIAAPGGIGESVVTWVGPDAHDFGDIIRNKPVSHEFTFKNVSKGAITIDNVRTSCGCTTSDWPELSVQPDSLGSLVITYDAHDEGYFRKTIKVYFSGQRRAEWLFIEGNVVTD